MQKRRAACPVLIFASLATVTFVSRPAPVEAQTVSQPVSVNVDLGTQSGAALLDANMTGQGSGTNGPQTAQLGANLSCSKDSWQTATTVGEIDCLSITLRQGGPGSDGSGILINTQNTGLGYSSDMEMVASSLDTSTNTNPYSLDVQLGVVSGGSSMYGIALSAVNGAGNAAVYVQSSNSASWSNLVQGVNSSGTTYFKVDGSGNVTTSGSVSTASLTTSGPVHAQSGIVTAVPASFTLRASDCGTTLRSTEASPVTMVVPGGLPLGCSVHVIQAGTGRITFLGRNRVEEHLGTGVGTPLATIGRYAEAALLIDSPHSVLLRGDVGVAGARSIGLVADRGPTEVEPRPATILQ